jgi:1-acyl-sn-glycerol-3-phosphate acyltransferase
MDSRRPILPIVVTGTANALPKRGFVLRGRHPIRLKVLDGIPYEAFAQDSVEGLTERVHSLIATELEKASPPRAS